MGGAVACEFCNITMLGNNTFEQNGLSGLPTYGGAVSVLNGRIQFKPGNTLFLRNEGNRGGAIIATISKLAIMCDDGAIIVLEGNKADSGGGGAYFVNSIVQV